MSLYPETFERDLHARMGEDYRLRWSSLTSTWNIEQHIGRGIWDIPANDWDDTAIRARDGYALVCSVHPRPFIVCPECHLTVAIRQLDIGEAICTYCTEKYEQRVSYFAGYFPLGDRLMDRLLRTSPARAKTWRAEMNARNESIRSRQETDWDNFNTDLWADWRNRLADRPQTGYGESITSKEDWTTT